MSENARTYYRIIAYETDDGGQIYGMRVTNPVDGRWGFAVDLAQAPIQSASHRFLTAYAGAMGWDLGDEPIPD